MGRHAGNRGNNKGFRTTEETWQAFLGHLATMSAIEVSKLPGMPSAPAFIKKRQRDAEFDSLATAALAARRLDNSGRKRITKEAWSRFVAQLPFMSINRLVEVDGMPSMAAVYSRRRKDAAFRAQLDGMRAAIRHARHVAQKPAKPRPIGEAIGAALLHNELYAAASAAVASHLERHTRLDIISDLVLAVLEGEINVADLKKAAKEFTKRHWKMFGTIATVSLDAPVSPGSKATIGDRLCGEASSYWG